ncbi:MAG: Spy/CpxP family protein refolding chaperone [Alphaproteobacteria bacterium]
MNRNLTLALATVTGIGLGAAGVATLDVAEAAGGPHGWGARGGHGIARFCTADRDGRLDDMLGFADSFLRLDDNQRPAWDGLAQSLRGANTRIDAACAELGDGIGASAPARLAAVETLLGTGLDIVKQVRPAFDGFYATLDDDQKQALDQLMDRRRRG